MSTTISKRLTYDDYAKLPEGAPYELIDGQLVHEPAPLTVHQKVSARISNALMNFVEARGLGEVYYAPTDVYLSDIDTYQPDVIFISAERKEIIGAKKVEGAPDLVIEILSPSTAKNDLGHKKLIYERSGVREYWIVDPRKRSIELLRNGADGFVRVGHAKEVGDVSSTLLPGFSVDLQQLFR